MSGLMEAIGLGGVFEPSQEPSAQLRIIDADDYRRTMAVYDAEYRFIQQHGAAYYVAAEWSPRPGETERFRSAPMRQRKSAMKLKGITSRSWATRRPAGGSTGAGVSGII